MSIKLVLFDIGNVTLTPYNYVSFYNLSRPGVDFQTFINQYRSNMKYTQSRFLGDPEICSVLRECAQSKLSDKELLHNFKMCQGNMNLEVLRAINVCEHYALETGVLSNIDSVRANDLIKMTKGQLFKYFFMSCDMGMMKPSPEVFERVEKVTEYKGEQILFFDDNEDNVNAAKKFGWRVYQVLDVQRSDIASVIEDEVRYFE